MQPPPPPVRNPPQAVLPAIGVFRNGSPTEGSPAAFTLTRTGATSTSLTVRVTVSETGEMVAAQHEGTQTVTFEPGSATAELRVPSVDDTVDEGHSIVTVRIMPDASRYVIRDKNEGSALVADNDVSPDDPVWAAVWSGTALAEGGPGVTVTLSNTNLQSSSTKPVLILVHVGRSEGTAGADDIVVTQGGKTLARHETGLANRHHSGGWEYVGTENGVAQVRIAAVANDGAEPAETLAVWIDADNQDISSRTLTIASSLDNVMQVQSRSDNAATTLLPALSVADAEVEEAQGATLGFTVTLSRALSETVTVDYATADGTARGGSDYTRTSGTLTFHANEVIKTVSVPVLDDNHDEGSETLTLTLSNPSENARIADGTGTGTIENDDPMPKAWLARLGRTVAEQVIEAVARRLSDAPRPGVEVRVAGEHVGGGFSPDKAAALPARLRGADGEAGVAGFRSRAVTERDLMTGTSFAVAGGSAAGGIVALWGRGAITRLDGRQGALSLDGEVTSVMVGADWSRGPGTVGVLLSHSPGEVGYRSPGCAGEVSSALTGVYPYGRYRVNGRVSVWGTAGYGTGGLTLKPEAARPIDADMDLAMAGAGVRGGLLAPTERGGPTLALTSDGFFVRTTSEAVPGALAAAEADVTRLRAGLEGALPVPLGSGRLVLSLEIGLRLDGGDAETGFGTGIGAGLAWSDPSTGVEAEMRAQGLLSHDAPGLRDRGIAGSLAWDPEPSSDRDFALTLHQTVGAPAARRMNALLSRRTLGDLAAGDDGDDLDRRRLEARLGYGFALFADRFTGTPEVSVGLFNTEREYSVGWRFTMLRREREEFEVGVEARRREAANGGSAPDHRLDFGLTARW